MKKIFLTLIMVLAIITAAFMPALPVAAAAPLAPTVSVIGPLGDPDAITIMDGLTIVAVTLNALHGKTAINLSCTQPNNTFSITTPTGKGIANTDGTWTYSASYDLSAYNQYGRATCTASLINGNKSAPLAVTETFSINAAP